MNQRNAYTVAFYNLENLFDTVNDPNILDDDFTAEGRLMWTRERYENKIHKLGMAISQIGEKDAAHPPAFIGVAEVENKAVLNDLVASADLKKYNYKYVHFNSPDERGIDTALLYCSDLVEVLEAKPITLLVYNQPNIRDFTRDILYVRAEMGGEEIHVFVNHWPSRRQGAGETAHKRIAAAKLIHEHIDEIRLKHASPKFIIMGDFNDDPNSTSIKDYLVKDRLYNPMLTLLNPTERGSLTHKAAWNLFDQIIISTNFFDVSEGKLRFKKADILDERFLEEWDKKYEGFPFRTYVGKKYLGGYSDHFPVYLIFSAK
ncbi:endonuclease/exonuclease/phosphatase family protein [Galbibacter mesophilus]|uniref:endonuclease/exonuclease/phosphatase family protein n=1 Tax=Galbibacter mesophilus TaxID=379069 RepID=UPI00191D26EB|nr:endonuclease/exonuclease/phosphatase family protein [Galbibacter mesophilus]MCM5662159.1 endonuclease [Galbibacter mesophilus]